MTQVSSFRHEVKCFHLLTLMITCKLKGQSKYQKGYDIAIDFEEIMGLDYVWTGCAVRPKAARPEVRECGHWIK